MALGDQKGTMFPEAEVSRGGGSGQLGQVPCVQNTDAGKTCGAMTLRPAGMGPPHTEGSLPLWTGVSSWGAEGGPCVAVRDIYSDGFCFQGHLPGVRRGRGRGLRRVAR